MAEDNSDLSHISYQAYTSKSVAGLISLWPRGCVSAPAGSGGGDGFQILEGNRSLVVVAQEGCMPPRSGHGGPG